MTGSHEAENWVPYKLSLFIHYECKPSEHSTRGAGNQNLHLTINILSNNLTHSSKKYVFFISSFHVKVVAKFKEQNYFTDDILKDL